MPILYFILQFKNKINIQKCLEILSKIVDDVYKSTSKFDLTISKKCFNKWPLSGDVRNLEYIITISISKKIVQKHTDKLDNIKISTNEHGHKNQSCHLFKYENDSDPAPLQNKSFP